MLLLEWLILILSVYWFNFLLLSGGFLMVVEIFLSFIDFEGCLK